MTEAEAKALSDTAKPNRPTIEPKACPPPDCHYMRKHIMKYCRTHAAKAADCSRHVDAEVLSLAGQEIERLQRDYALFEELAPPDVPRAEFVRWCFEAWEREQKESSQ